MFDWSKAPSWVRYATMDKFGYWNGWVLRPHADDRGYWTALDGTPDMVRLCEIRHPPFSGNWRDSLQDRVLQELTDIGQELGEGPNPLIKS